MTTNLKSRAVILPTPCDPFLLKYWIDNFKKFYQDEVTKLYVCLNSTVEKEVIDYEIGLLNTTNADYIYIDHQIEHGDALRRLLGLVSEEYIMLAEDDAFVFKKGFVDNCFSIVENEVADVVGSKRGSCSFEILEEAKRLWGVDYEGIGDTGCNFWPAFLFTKTETLRNTDQRFEAKSWNKGEKIEWLNGYVMKELGCGDTLVNTSLQLRYKNLKFHYINQYHGGLEDMRHYEKRTHLWDGLAPCTHVGSLSSGLGGVLVNDKGICLARRKVDVVEKEFVLPEANVEEWERRVQFWKTFYDNSDDSLPEFKEEYLKAINRIMAKAKIHPKNILRRQVAYKELGL